MLKSTPVWQQSICCVFILCEGKLQVLWRNSLGEVCQCSQQGWAFKTRRTNRIWLRKGEAEIIICQAKAKVRRIMTRIIWFVFEKLNNWMWLKHTQRILKAHGKLHVAFYKNQNLVKKAMRHILRRYVTQYYFFLEKVHFRSRGQNTSKKDIIKRKQSW